MSPDEMTPAFHVAQVLTCAIAVAAAAWVLRGAMRARGRVAVGDVARAGIWLVGVGGMLTLAGLCSGVVHAFGVIRLGFLAGVLCIPLVGGALFALAAMGKVRLTAAAGALVAASLLGAPLGWWMAWVEPYDLRLETADLALPEERAGEEPIRIGVFADLQCEEVGEHERRAVAMLLAEEPDLILVPGDLYQGTDEDWADVEGPLLELLGTVRAPYGVYFVPGDTDHRPQIRAVRERTDWTVLVNEIVDVPVKDRQLRIAGLANRASVDVARELEAMRGETDVRIVMSHAPDTVLALRGPPRADLIVAGHTHGGQIVVPWYGPPMTLSHVPREIARGGLHTYEGRSIYVGRGIGLERRQAPRVRLLCPPEVSVLTLRSVPATGRR
jgi:predicted MPP superfamily phosphohydrolase